MIHENTSAVRLTDYLTEDRILFLAGKQSKDDVLNSLIEVLAEIPDIDGREEIAPGIFHRESLLSTGIGNGIAIPHHRLNSMDETYMAVAVIPEGIADYQTPDSQLIRLVFMIIAGKNQKTIHVKLLAEIARLFDGRLKAAFLASSDPHTCMDILKIAEK